MSATVEVKALKLGASPRLEPQDLDHARALAGRFDDLPPIVVQAGTCCVIDGVHRVLAARIAERTEVPVEFFEGTETEAYVESVRRNTAHGKPLTLKERRHAAKRILALCPTWADRRIAEACGLSARLVAQLRADGQIGEATERRLGRDGKQRPTDPAEARLRIAAALQADPGIPIRRVAEEIGTSPATVSDVRKRLRRGQSPIPTGLAQRSNVPTPPEPAPVKAIGWRGDAAFGASPELQRFMEWFDEKRIVEEEWQELIEVVPLGRLYAISDEARRLARAWRDFADALEQRARCRSNRRLDAVR